MKYMFLTDKLPVKILLYLICAGIIAFYCYVLYLGTKPNVSEQYRAYYIDHTVTEWTE